MKGIKKKIIFWAIFICLTAAFILLLNIKVTTRQGINYKVHTKRIPLYFKASGFIHRHFAYKQLLKEILKNDQTDKEKVLAIFEWTYKNIRKVPEDFPVIDDHILNIITQGYGTSDQSADVFCLLCEYAGFPAAWAIISPESSGNRLAVSLVELNGKKRLFDTYCGNYFFNQKGEIATVNDIIYHPELINQAKNRPIIGDIEYKKYLEGLKYISDKDLWKRGKPQMLLHRLINEIKKVF